MRQKAFGTLDQSTRPSDSILPHVRSDAPLYDKLSGPQVTQLTADYLFRPGANLYGRLSAGYFEPMFSGVSGEILWYPQGSRLALGMHWPQDLIVATLISWLLVTLATWLAQRFCGPLSPPGEEAQDIKKRAAAPE